MRVVYNAKWRSVVSGAPQFAIYMYETRVTSYREKTLNFDVSQVYLYCDVK
jgi:hypothetical protein